MKNVTVINRIHIGISGLSSSSFQETLRLNPVWALQNLKNAGSIFSSTAWSLKEQSLSSIEGSCRCAWKHTNHETQRRTESKEHFDYLERIKTTTFVLWGEWLEGAKCWTDSSCQGSVCVNSHQCNAQWIIAVPKNLLELTRKSKGEVSSQPHKFWGFFITFSLLLSTCSIYLG